MLRARLGEGLTTIGVPLLAAATSAEALRPMRAPSSRSARIANSDSRPTSMALMPSWKCRGSPDAKHPNGVEGWLYQPPR